MKTGDLLTFADEGEEVEKEFQGKKKVQLQISVTLPSGDDKKAGLNGTSRNNMIEAYGADTARWVGKQARVEALKENVSGKVRTVLYLTHPSKDIEGNLITE